MCKLDDLCCFMRLSALWRPLLPTRLLTAAVTANAACYLSVDGDEQLEGGSVPTRTLLLLTPF